MESPKTTTQICIEANLLAEAGDLGGLSNLWIYVCNRIENYPVVEVAFILEHLEELARKMARCDAEMLLKYLLQENE